MVKSILATGTCLSTNISVYQRLLKHCVSSFAYLTRFARLTINSIIDHNTDRSLVTGVAAEAIRSRR